ncbi:hypothetical protein CEXT_207661 [Caerostris extrusa]|uniref:Uncharacterized protein n=1 Tax=Caerostris extrusa TaxID=172846 RepID=A0AAV4W0U7_CAEEX|nr:hypothetical protein CEXT_207661 [Caerostris extrusa]
MSLGNIMSYPIPVMGNGQLCFQHFYISLSRGNFLTSYFYFFNEKISLELFKGSEKFVPLRAFSAYLHLSPYTEQTNY